MESTIEKAGQGEGKGVQLRQKQQRLQQARCQ